MAFRRITVMKALIKEQSKQIASGEKKEDDWIWILFQCPLIYKAKEQKVSELKAGLDEAESLKMDLEARSLQSNVKVVLLAKLREYKSDVNNLKAKVKRITSTNLNQAARDDLLES